MPEKAKQVAITINRVNRENAKIVQATGFKLRQDKSTGCIEISIERRGGRGERVSFEPMLIQQNFTMMKRYIAGMPCDEDDQSLKEEIAVSDIDTYSNIMHLCQMGNRAETIFGVFRFADWVAATKADSKSNDREIHSFDAVVVLSSSGLQKKLMLELLAIIGEHTEQK